MLPELNPIELIFLGAVALIFIGPKDLPVVLRKIGEWTARMRGLAAEFRASFDEMARQSELDELRKEVEALRTGQFAAAHAPDLQSHVDEINQHLSTPYWDGGSQTYGMISEAEEVAALPPVSEPTPEAAAKAPRKRTPKVKAEASPAADASPPRPRKAPAAKSASDAPKPPRKRAAKSPSAEPAEA